MSLKSIKQTYYIHWCEFNILGHGGPGSNSDEEVTPHFLDLQNWGLTTGSSLVSYFFRGMRFAYSTDRPNVRKDINMEESAFYFKASVS